MYLRKITKVKLRGIYVIFNLLLSLGLTSRNILKFKFYLRKKINTQYRNRYQCCSKNFIEIYLSATNKKWLSKLGQHCFWGEITIKGNINLGRVNNYKNGLI